MVYIYIYIYIYICFSQPNVFHKVLTSCIYGCTVHTCISSFCDISSLLCPYLHYSVQAVSLGHLPHLWYSWFSSSWHITQHPWTWVLVHMQWSDILEWYRVYKVCLVDRIFMFLCKISWSHFLCCCPISFIFNIFVWSHTHKTTFTSPLSFYF